MKKIIPLIFCYLALCPFVSSLYAVNYCASAPWGYGSSATGGSTAAVTKVATLSELKSALGKGNNVILITKSITIDKTIDISKSNITILGMTGVTLTNKTKDQGVFHFNKGSNYIIRNIAFVGPSATSNQGGDLLCFEGAKNAWVDHCSFDDGADGNFDICKGADNITVTWCRFKYSTETTHNFSNLVGSSSTDAASDGTFNISYGYCWWDEGCHQRMVRSRNASFHFLNCYWNSSVAEYYIGLENSDAYIEGCWFGGSLSGSKIMGQGNSWYKDSKNGFMFVNCHSDKSLPSEDHSRTVTVPSYTSPAALTYTEAKAAVTNAACGAGATLTVNDKGEVSSSCDTETPDTPKPETPNPSDEEDGTPVSQSVFWNISDDDFNALDTITSETVVRKMHIMADASNTIVVDASGKASDGYSFTHRLKFGGSGSATARHLWFRVSGPCTLTVWLMSASGTEDRTLNIAAGSFTDIVQEMPAATAIAKQTFDYTGDATTLYLYSKKSGVNIYAVKLDFPDDGTDTGLDELQTDQMVYGRCENEKILINGTLFIRRGNTTYTITAQKVR